MRRGTWLASGFSFLFFVSSAWATDVPLQDPSYLPTGGHLITDTDLSFQRSSYNGTEAFESFHLGTNTYDLFDPAKIREDIYSVNQSVQYGVTEGLVIGVGEGCSYRDEKETYEDFFGVSSATFTAHGCGDPTATIIYRGLHQTDLAELPVNIDVSVSYSPDLVKASTDHPNDAPGGQSGDVNLAISRVFSDFTLLGRVGVSWTGKESLSGTGETLSFSANHSEYLDGVGQYRPFDDLFVTLGGRVASSYQTTRTESLGNFFEDGDLVGSVKEKAGYTYTPYVGLSYALIPELLSGSLHYQHSFEGAIKTFDGESGASDGTFIGRADDFIELSLRVLWF